MENSDTVQGISIGEFLRYAGRHWAIPAIIIILAPLLGYGYSLLQTPLYSAQADLTVTSGGSGQSAGISRSALLSNYVSLVTSSRVLNPVAEELNNDPNADTIADGLTAKNKSGTEVISIEYSTPQKNGALVVEKVIESLKVSLEDLYDVKPSSVIVFTQPEDSGEPYNIKVANNILIAFGGGLALALLITFIRFDNHRAKLNGSPIKIPKDQLKRTAEENAELQEREMAVRRIEIEAREVEARARIAKAKTQLSSTGNNKSGRRGK